MLIFLFSTGWRTAAPSRRATEKFEVGGQRRGGMGWAHSNKSSPPIINTHRKSKTHRSSPLHRHRSPAGAHGHELLIWGRFYRNTPQDTRLARQHRCESYKFLILSFKIFMNILEITIRFMKSHCL
jgi:hypothetical protein